MERAYELLGSLPLASQEQEIKWLQVFQRAPTALLGSSGGPAQRSRLVPSEKCAVRLGGNDDEMRMITAGFVRAIAWFSSDLYLHFHPLFQQVVEIKKTCNQFYDSGPSGAL